MQALLLITISLNALTAAIAFQPSVPAPVLTPTRARTRSFEPQPSERERSRPAPRAPRRASPEGGAGDEAQTPRARRLLSLLLPLRPLLPRQPPPPATEIATLEELNGHYSDPRRTYASRPAADYDALLARLSVTGQTQNIGDPSAPATVHPVLRLLHQRRRTASPLTPVQLQPRADGAKVALVVEGGGMRGCVTAGMVAALHYLGLEDAFDVIYGSSAGTVIGAYFNTRQLPFFGPEIYYDSLTTAGTRFIDTRRLLRVLGVGLLDPRLLRDVLTRRGNGKPVLALDYLLRTTMIHNKPLDWDTFVRMQKVQPLKVLASNLHRQDVSVLEMANNAFTNIDELSSCMHASCLIPGIAGPLMNIDMTQILTNNTTNTTITTNTTRPKFALGNNLNTPPLEPHADALVYQPIPYQTAITENATHILVLRSMPDGTDVTGTPSPFDPPILRRFFLRKNNLPQTFSYLRNRFHKRKYGEQILDLNRYAKQTDRDYTDMDNGPHVMTVALPPGSPGVKRLEVGRREIFDGVRRGFARTYDALVEEAGERGRGEEVASMYFPEDILDYDPREIQAGGEAAFDFYRRGVVGRDFPESLGKTAKEAGLPR